MLNAYTWFGLKVNIRKTKILVLVLSQKIPNLNITILETPLEKGDYFSNKYTSEKDVKNKLRVVHIVFGGTRERVFKKDMNHLTKLSIFKAVVISDLLNGCETWTPYQNDIKNSSDFTNRSSTLL